MKSKPLVKRPEIRLAMLGMVDGNGHPYSWSAIINGYARKKMTKECPFPSIPEYLNREPASAFNIKAAKFTHIYCHKRKDAEHIAQCSLIPKVVETPEAMLGQVDAVVIATDAGAEHVTMARPLVEADMPLFIDKPLCDSRKDLQVFSRWVKGGRAILSSSNRRYAREILEAKNKLSALGPLRFLSMTMVKKWETYGIHALESVYTLLGPGFLSLRNTGSSERNIVHLQHRKGVDVVIACGADLHLGAIRILGVKGELLVACRDVFGNFKAQLQSFICYLQTGRRPDPVRETEELITMLIAGSASRANGGREIRFPLPGTCSRSSS